MSSTPGGPRSGVFIAPPWPTLTCRVTWVSLMVFLTRGLRHRRSDQHICPTSVWQPRDQWKHQCALLWLEPLRPHSLCFLPRTKCYEMSSNSDISFLGDDLLWNNSVIWVSLWGFFLVELLNTSAYKNVLFISIFVHVLYMTGVNLFWNSHTVHHHLHYVTHLH